LRLAAALLVVCVLAPVCRAGDADAGAPPRFEVPGPEGEAPLVFVCYGDTRFSKREDIVNTGARQALVKKIASERPAAIFIGGDLVFEGANADDYATFKDETVAWADQKVPIFPALGNHEFRGCTQDVDPCLENWWSTFNTLRPHRWYSATIGSTVLALVLDSDSPLKPASEQRQWFERQIAAADPRIRFVLIVMHYPPVRDPVYPRVRDEQEIYRYLSHKAPSLRAQVIVVGSHVHNYERYQKDGVTYLVSGGGGAKPVPAFRMFGERSKLTTGTNFHYIRFTLRDRTLSATMVRFDSDDRTGNPWSEPDRFEVTAKK
jgi:hypothetical protein